MSVSVIAVSGWAHGPLDTDHLTGAAAAVSLALSDSVLAASDDPVEAVASIAGEQSTGTRRFGIGWSTGAMMLLESAARHPGLYTGLVLVSASARFCRTDDYPHGVEERNLRAMSVGIKRDPVAVLQAFLSDCSHPAVVCPAALADAANAAAAPGSAVLLRGLDYLRRTDLRASLEQVRCPVVVVHGEADRIIPASAGRFLAAHLSTATFRPLADLGHDIPLRLPAAVSEAFRELSERCA